MLSVTALDALKSKDKRYSKKDSDNLFIRITPKGKKIWEVRYSFEGKQTKVDIGTYPALTVMNARAKRDSILNDAENGVDAIEVKREEKLKLKSKIIATDVNAVIDEFIERDLNKNRIRPEQPIRSLDHNVRPVIGNLKLESITRFHINKVLDDIVDRGAPVVANRLSTLLGQLFDYAVDRGYISENPASNIKKRNVGGIEKSRERVLSWQEVSDFLQGLPEIPSHETFKNILRMALSTGQRISTICGASLSEFHFDMGVWLIPKSSAKRLTKSNSERELPISEFMLDIIKNQLAINQSDEFLFEQINNCKEPVEYNSVMSVLRRNSVALGCPVDKELRYTLHDLRRTFATLVNELVINGRQPDPYVVEMVLGHKLRLTGTSHIYNRNTYLAQQLEVLNIWGDRLSLISSNENNVELLTPTKAVSNV